MSTEVNKITPTAVFGCVKQAPLKDSKKEEDCSGTLKTLGTLALLSAVSAGIAGNGVWTYQNIQDQNKTNVKVNEELTKSNQAIEELNKLLQKEKELNISQKDAMGLLTNELSSTKATQVNFFEKINRLKEEMASKITLDHVVEIVKMVSPFCVMVEGEAEMVNPFTGQSEKIRGNGSGIIVTSKTGERYILTNAHVTENHEIRNNVFKDGVYHVKVYNGTDFQSPIEFDAPPVILKNGQRAHSNLKDHDLAVLKIPPDVKLATHIGRIQVRDITKEPLKAGEMVIAIGAPNGLRDSITFGIISNPDREITMYNKNHFIQTDAPINFGNSGGGLFDMQGRLIGINCWKFRGDGLAASMRVDEIIKLLNEWAIEMN